MNEYECLECGNKDNFVETRTDTKVYWERCGLTGFATIRHTDLGEITDVKCYECGGKVKKKVSVSK